MRIASGVAAASLVGEIIRYGCRPSRQERSLVRVPARQVASRTYPLTADQPVTCSPQPSTSPAISTPRVSGAPRGRGSVLPVASDQLVKGRRMDPHQQIIGTGRGVREFSSRITQGRRAGQSQSRACKLLRCSSRMGCVGNGEIVDPPRAVYRPGVKGLPARQESCTWATCARGDQRPIVKRQVRMVDPAARLAPC